MRIRHLRAVGWRNLAPLELDLDPSVRLNVLFGDNGQGKTNLIEALYYLAAFRSFRTTRAADLVQRGANGARIGVDVDTRDLARSLDVRLARGEPEEALAARASGAAPVVSRRITLDGKAVRGVANAYGAVSVVLFVPEDLLLIRAAPALRRRFIDMAISGIEPAYYGEAAAFQKILRSRNALLRAGRMSAAPSLLDTYDEQLARAGARVVARRRQLVSALAPDVARTFQATHADLPVALNYVSAPSVQAALSESEVVSALLTGMGQRRALDERRGYSTFGPHTDDLDIHLDGRPAREHASQGQLRSLVLALKLAELASVETRRGDAPVLLLDDVPSELDPTRRQFLFEMIASLSCQTLVSVADRTVIPRRAERAEFLVKAGALTAAAK